MGYPKCGICDGPGGYEALHTFAVRQRELFRNLRPIDAAPLTVRLLSTRDIRVRIITDRLVSKYVHQKAGRQAIEGLDHHDIAYWNLCFRRDDGAVGAILYIRGHGPRCQEASVRWPPDDRAPAPIQPTAILMGHDPQPGRRQRCLCSMRLKMAAQHEIGAKTAIGKVNVASCRAMHRHHREASVGSACCSMQARCNAPVVSPYKLNISRSSPGTADGLAGAIRSGLRRPAWRCRAQAQVDHEEPLEGTVLLLPRLIAGGRHGWVGALTLEEALGPDDPRRNLYKRRGAAGRDVEIRVRTS
jgi:5' nucleotidase, deoxy (Pyrimidine), cytosolic type C protein (NT5C)